MEHSIRRLLRTKKICRSRRVLSASSLRLWRIAPSSICIILHIILSLVQQLLIKREKLYDYLLILNLNMENFALEMCQKIFLKASHFFLCEKTFFKFQNDFTVQLRYIRTTHTRIIRAYFAYTRMSIRAHARVYTRTYVRIYARIGLFVMHSHKFLYMKDCLSNKGHFWE